MIIACVWTGKRYGIEYVERLRDMVARNMERPYEFVCITDRPEGLAHVTRLDAPMMTNLPLAGWWAKMLLFQGRWRQGKRVVYLDLDTVVARSLEPLCAAAGNTRIATCENFTRLALGLKVGAAQWPCKYNSSIITISEDTTDVMIWDRFYRDGLKTMERLARFGDQMALEEAEPNLPFLQSMLPPGYILNYRNISQARAARAHVVCFGGQHKPHNCAAPWVRDAWIGAGT